MDSQRLGAIFTLFFILGCSGYETPRWDTFPVPIYLDSTAGCYRVTQDEVETTLLNAMNFWNQKAGRQLFDYRGAWQGTKPYNGDLNTNTNYEITANVIMIFDPWPLTSSGSKGCNSMSYGCTFYGTHSSLTNIFEHNLIGLRQGWCANERVAMHELGHFIGLLHVEDPSNIMYKTMMAYGTNVDEEALRRVTE